MMTPAELALSRELARHPEFPRAPRSMYLDELGRSWTHVGAGVYVDGMAQIIVEPVLSLIPDLSDPATWGALLAQLPQTAAVNIDPYEITVEVWTGSGYDAHKGPTWGEAVARAWLETRGGGK